MQVSQQRNDVTYKMFLFKRKRTFVLRDRSLLANVSVVFRHNIFNREKRRTSEVANKKGKKKNLERKLIPYKNGLFFYSLTTFVFHLFQINDTQITNYGQRRKC
jgi:hypothetical protein